MYSYNYLNDKIEYAKENLEEFAPFVQTNSLPVKVLDRIRELSSSIFPGENSKVHAAFITGFLAGFGIQEFYNDKQ